MTAPISQKGIQIQSDAVGLTALRHLKTLDFELAYLALLTREGLKPLSRWEKPLDPSGLDALQQGRPSDASRAPQGQVGQGVHRDGLWQDTDV